MADGQITYTDLVKPTDSITKAIEQLTQLEAVYADLLNKIKTDAKTVENSIKGASGANKEQRDAIKKSVTDVDKLAKAEKALSDSRKNNAIELAKMKAIQQEQNNLTKLSIKLNKSKEGSYNKLSAQYSLNKIRLNKMTAEERLSTKAGRKLEIQTKRIYEEMNRLQKATGKAQLQVGQYERGIGKLKSGLISAGKAMVGMAVASLGVRAVFGEIKKGVQTIANFGEAMDKVAAVTDANNSNFKALTDNAKELGRVTSRSATDVSALQLSFAKLGFSTQEILNATEATISLSIAAGSDLAESAVVAASTIRGFGLEAKASQRIVDVMAKSFASSALDLEKFKVSMSAVAPIAKANGKDLEFVTARLSVLSDAGLDASTSGTSLRNMFLELSKRGLTWDEGLAKINESTDKNVTALDLFGKRGATAALILADNIDKAEGLEGAYNRATGSAKKMADVMEDNLIGDTKKLSSAWEGWILSSSNGITRLGRQVVQFATRMLGSLNKETKDHVDLSRLDNREMNISINALKDGNLPREAKLKLMDKINDQYGDYLPYLITEKTSVEDIGKAQAEANKQFRLRIIQKAFEEEMTEVLKREANAVEALAESQIAAAEDAQKIATNDTEAKLLDQSKAINKLGEEYSKSVIENNETEVEAVKTKFKKIAELYNIAFSEIESVLTGSTKKVENEEDKKILAYQKTALALKSINQEANIEITKNLTDPDKDESYNLVKANIQKTIENGKKAVEDIKKGMEGDGSLDLYDLLGINISDEGKEAISISTQFAIDQVNSLLQAKVDAAERGAEAADKEVDAAQNRLQNEIDARNGGYANSVATAQKELALAKKTQKEALKEQEKAAKAQRTIESLQQASSLVTGAAKIWGTLGFPWAIPAIALMFGSFAFAKIKSAQVSKQSYGDGGLEFLEGGSHASGNDIQMGMTADGKDRRMEGGEAMAVINKNKTRKYRGILPEVIGALNKGNFEQKYMGAYSTSGLTIGVVNRSNNLKSLESDVSAIREQNERRYHTDSNGRVVETYKNLRRIYVN